MHANLEPMIRWHLARRRCNFNDDVAAAAEVFRKFFVEALRQLARYLQHACEDVAMADEEKSVGLVSRSGCRRLAITEKR